jgi:hypothetical protein
MYMFSNFIHIRLPGFSAPARAGSGFRGRAEVAVLRQINFSNWKIVLLLSRPAQGMVASIHYPQLETPRAHLIILRETARFTSPISHTISIYPQKLCHPEFALNNTL